jgi:ubiquinol-cytochrome c reductase cytochrome b subunit
LIVGLVIAHISLLHIDGSNNPLGTDTRIDVLGFYPYLVSKDIFGFCLLLIVFFYLVCFDPNVLGHPDNYIKADALVTPAHIVPE